MKKSAGMDRGVTARWRPATRAVRGGTWRSEHGETSEALFLSSGYSYDDAATVAARFTGEAQGMTYSRLQNPTVAMLEERIALMEGAEACRTQASGMAAMTAALLSQLSAGDHIVAARAAFGSCRWLVDHLCSRFGIDATVIDSAVNGEWDRAIRPNTLTRKNALFAGSDGGARHWAIAMSLIQTAKRAIHNPPHVAASGASGAFCPNDQQSCGSGPLSSHSESLVH